MFSMKLKSKSGKTEKFLKRTLGKDYRFILSEYGRKGVLALQANTPKDTGILASSWRYEVTTNNNGSMSIEWHNDDIEGTNTKVNVAILIQYGHATRNGYFVEGIDYINPALKPIFDDLAEHCWKEVTKS